MGIAKGVAAAVVALALTVALVACRGGTAVRDTEREQVSAAAAGHDCYTVPLPGAGLPGGWVLWKRGVGGHWTPDAVARAQLGRAGWRIERYCYR